MATFNVMRVSKGFRDRSTDLIPQGVWYRKRVGGSKEEGGYSLGLLGDKSRVSFATK